VLHLPGGTLRAGSHAVRITGADGRIAFESTLTVR